MRIGTGEVGRDAHVIGVVGVAHFTSHFFHLALPPLFPVLPPASRWRRDSRSSSARARRRW
jgi:hypothetical protein